MKRKMMITWLGHSCFKVESNGYSIIFDPYSDGNVPGLKPLREVAHQVLCSHTHDDHNFVEAITLEKTAEDCPFQIHKISTYHDDKKGTLRGENTIHVLDDGVFRIAHLGDLGCELEAEQLEQLKNLDVVLIPIGGYYTISANQAKALVDIIQPRIVIPMHYRGDGFGFDEIETLDTYTKLCDDVVWYDGNQLEVDDETRKQTAILRLCM